MSRTIPPVKLILATALVVLSTAGVASAQGSSADASARLSAADKAFVMKTAMANNYELASAKIAQSMSGAAEDKEYAQHIIDDHTKVGAELSAAVAAADPSLTLPTGTDAKGTARLATLKKSRARFNSAYKQQMIDSHKEIHTMFQSYIDRRSANAGVKAVVAGAQPIVVMHWNAAKTLPSR